MLQERLAQAECALQEVRNSHREQLMRLHESQQLDPSAAAGGAQAAETRIANAEAAANTLKQENVELQQQVISVFSFAAPAPPPFFACILPDSYRYHPLQLRQHKLAAIQEGSSNYVLKAELERVKASLAAMDSARDSMQNDANERCSTQEPRAPL